MRGVLPTAIFLVLGASLLRSEPAWMTDLDRAIDRGMAEGKPLAIWVVSRDCPTCRARSRDVFGDPRVEAVLDTRFVPVRINADDSAGRAMAQRTGAAPGSLLVWHRAGQTLPGHLVSPLLAHPDSALALLDRLSVRPDPSGTVIRKTVVAPRTVETPPSISDDDWAVPAIAPPPPPPDTTIPAPDSVLFSAPSATPSSP